MSKVKIVVATHKKSQMPSDEMYLPVLVGAKKNQKADIHYQRDDDGENISEKNPNYNELTAVYWAWKNLDASYTGIVHYRRFFSLKMKSDIGSILNSENIDRILEKHSVILPKKRHYYIETNYSHYIHAHHQEPLDTCRDIIKVDHPECLESFDKIMNKRSAHMFNMFIMRKDLFDNYCEWLFTILRKLESSITIDEYSDQEKRVYGYISELLLDVWIDKNNVDFEEVNVVQIGPKHIFKKAFFFLKRKFSKGTNNRTHF